MKINLLKLTTLLFLSFVRYSNVFSQKLQVALTIDDVPNLRIYHLNNNKSKLLSTIDSLKIPIGVFINEGLIYNQGDTLENINVLKKWIKNKHTTIGNHTFNHSRLSDIGIKEFVKDIEKGETNSKIIAKKYNKNVNIFRFPYNDLGVDSAEHTNIEKILFTKKYKIVPFTIESADWMFNVVYEYYLANGNIFEAKKIGKEYVNTTLKYFKHFETLSLKLYNRNVKHIYIFHDNTLNTNNLAELINELKKQKYKFINIDEALKDPIYQQRNLYYKKWGISWFYRWMKNKQQRQKWMSEEPNTDNIEQIYNKILNVK